MRVLGITGGVATGKSTVTRMFAELGAATVSADVLARDLLAPGTETTRAVLAAFPECALPNALVPTIDRRVLGRTVFANPDARARLEALTHPPIIAALRAQVAEWHQVSGTAAAAEIPLLFETGLETLCDWIVVVSCEEAVQRDRLTQRLDGDEAEARRIIAAQWPLSQKIARAHSVITTDQSLEDTRRQVQALWDGLV